MSFQAIIRDSIGDLVSDDSIGLRMSILQGSESGTVVYSETHGGRTNEIGLITLEIGGGTVVSGDFAAIDWANGPYFFKREIDPLGGFDYVITGTSQVMSVPFALYTNVADTALNTPPVFDGDYTSLTNKPAIPTKTSDITNDSGFLTAEGDGSNSNEIQTISKVDRTVTLSNSGGSFVDSVLTEAQVDAYVNNNGYLTVEGDGSNSNEIQTISKVDRTVTLSNSGGSFVDSVLTEAQVDAYVNNNGYFIVEGDGSNSNEIQTISKVDRTVTLSNSGGSFVDSVLNEAQVDTYVNNNGYFTVEGDGSNSNEIQTISKLDRTVTLSNSGGSFVDSVLNEAQVDTYASNNGYLTTEGDGSNSNEIQALSVSITGDTLYISGSNFVIITGISLYNAPLVDVSGNTYDTVHIGDQIWMKSNLKTTHYRGGTPIPHVTSNWSGLSTGARAYYDNDSTANASVYGALYNWYAVQGDSLCPTGWHVPNRTEWDALKDYLGGISKGNKLKEVGTVHWNWPNTGATDEFGFTALPGGLRSESGSFSNIGNRGYWWSKRILSGFPFYRFLLHDNTNFMSSQEDINAGASVRCLKD